MSRESKKLSVLSTSRRPLGKPTVLRNGAAQSLELQVLIKFVENATMLVMAQAEQWTRREKTAQRFGCLLQRHAGERQLHFEGPELV